MCSLLTLTALNAGPLWRDEALSANLAQTPSWTEFWNNLRFDSFPALWLLVLRGWSYIGFAEADRGIRVLGLLIGLCSVASLWRCVRWMGGRTPILSLALLGSLPVYIGVVGANRAYGLALCLLFLTFGAIWRVVEVCTFRRAVFATAISILFLHCVYYDAVFLCAILAGASLIALRRKQWRTLIAVASIGSISCASLLIYVPTIRGASASVQISQAPFDWSLLWAKLSEAVSMESSAHWIAKPGPQIWLWAALVFGAVVATLLTNHRAQSAKTLKEGQINNIGVGGSRGDLTAFCGVSLVMGIAAYFCFLSKLQFPTQPWYYLGLIGFCAVAMECIFTVGSAGRWPWGLARVSLAVVLVGWGAGSVWEEAHTRRTNIDLIAKQVGKEAAEGDLVVVHSTWEGIAFDRYYHGRAKWITSPPIESHKLFRADLLLAKLSERNAITPVLAQMDSTLAGGHHVWLVGRTVCPIAAYPPPSLPPAPCLPTKWWLGPYLECWGEQLMAELLHQSRPTRMIPMISAQPVSYQENLPLRWL